MNNQLSDTFTYSPPVAPDTSKAAYDAASGPRIENNNYKPGWSPLGTTLGWWFNAEKNRNYEQWKLNQENEYNRALAAWQTYMSSPEAQKEAYESAGFNSNYTNPSSMSGASPGSYQHIEQDDALNNIGSMLSLAGQVAGLSSQSIGDVMNIINTASEVKTRAVDRNTKSLANQVTSLGLWKLAGELFDQKDLDNVMTWLSGGVVDIDSNKYPQGLNQYLTDAFKTGPFFKGLESKIKLTDEQRKKFSADIDNLIASLPGVEAKSSMLGKQDDLYMINQFIQWGAILMKVIAGFI